MERYSFLEYQYPGSSWMIQTSWLYLMWCVQTLGRHNWSVAHPFLQPNVPLCSGFRAGFLVFWGGKDICSWNISNKALPEWYTLLLYIPCNVCTHLEVIIEVVLISIYSQTYLCVVVYFWLSGLVNGLVPEVSVPRNFLKFTQIYIHLMWCVQTLGRHNRSGAHPFL